MRIVNDGDMLFLGIIAEIQIQVQIQIQTPTQIQIQNVDLN
jgi:hypothetical protein